MPAWKDLATVLYQPRETMRRVLDAGRDRWTVQIVILAFLATAVNDPDTRQITRVLPDLPMSALLALIALALILSPVIWLLFLYVIGWIATMVGRWLGGQGPVADVRAALAWSLVPTIWSVIVRIPLAIYSGRFNPEKLDLQTLGDIIASGGCSIFAIVAAFQMILYVWTLYIASNTLGEAMRFSSWKGLGTIAISGTLPFVLMIAAVLSFRG